MSDPRRTAAAAAAVVIRADERVLLIERGRAPSLGLWTLPGGRLEPGEDAAAAAAREVLEETGLEVRLLAFLETVQLARADGEAFVIDEFLAEPLADPDSLFAGDDASDARWVRRDDMAALGVNVEALGVIDRALSTRRARGGSW